MPKSNSNFLNEEHYHFIFCISDSVNSIGDFVRARVVDRFPAYFEARMVQFSPRGNNWAWSWDLCGAPLL
jgi:hypothetical protein